MIKLIVFDWDDVFTIGSREGYYNCYHETLVDLGVKLEPEEEKKRIKEKWGKSAREELKELLKESPSLLEKACNIYEKKLFSTIFTGCLKVIDGSVELVKKLSNNYILCIATGMNPILLKEKIMPKFGFPPAFQTILSVYDIKDPEKQKPSPFMVNEILGLHNIKPEDAVFVGDARGDVIMAKAASVTPIVVLTGYITRKEAEELGVKYIIENVTKLQSVLGTLDK